MLNLALEITRKATSISTNSMMMVVVDLLAMAQAFELLQHIAAVDAINMMLHYLTVHIMSYSPNVICACSILAVHV